MSTETSVRALMGYADKVSVRAGDHVKFLVSAIGHTEFRADFVRVRSAEAGPKAPPYREDVMDAPSAAMYPGRRQEIDAGAWGFSALDQDWTKGVAVQAYVWPTLPGKGAQFICGTWSEITRTGIGLRLTGDGRLEAVVGDGTRLEVLTGEPMRRRHWSFVAASYDPATGTLALVQEPADKVVQTADTAMAFARQIGVLDAYRCAGISFAAVPTAPGRPGRKPPFLAGQHFNGKIDRPRIATRALTRAEMSELRALEVPVALEPDIAGAWDFALDMGSERIRDRSSRRADGTLFNMPSRAATGHNWSGQEMDWKRAPELYGAIHFHEDDIHDCGWEPDVELVIPDHWPSGVYAARLRAGEDEFYIPFFLRAPRGKPSSKVAFLASTATYFVYSNLKARLIRHFWEASQGRLIAMDRLDELLFDFSELGLSTYDRHSDGSGVAYVSRLRPSTTIRPKGRLWNFPADLMVVDWLEHEGHGYDVISDDDLHAEGVAALDDHDVLVTGSHPEYFTTEMLDAVQVFLRRGGRLLYTGANGFYWRCAYHPLAEGVIELRRAEDGLRAWDAEPGEYYHSSNGEYGGLWRRNGRTPQMLTGVGFVAQGFDSSAPYRRTEAAKDPRAAFIFEGVDEEVFGDYGAMGNGAAGMEIDAADPDLGSPAHMLVLARSEGHSNVYELVNEEITIAHSATNVLHNPAIRAEITFFETTSGGAVFSTGSIAYAGALGFNNFKNACARLVGNVLRRFIDATPFTPPASKTKQKT